jgi:hypothetical protein
MPTNTLQNVFWFLHVSFTMRLGGGGGLRIISMVRLKKIVGIILLLIVVLHMVDRVTK